MRGASIGTGTLNLSALTLAETVDLRDTKVSQVRVPETSTITTLHLPATLTQLNLTAQPNINNMTIQGYGVLTQFVVTGSPLLGQALRIHILSMIEAGTEVTIIKLANLSWLSQPVDGDVIRWLIAVGDRGTCELTGQVATVSGAQGILFYEDVAKLIIRYGDIRSVDNPLFIRFSGTSIAQTAISIEGKKYINTDSTSSGYDLDAEQNFNDLALLVASGNDVAVATNSAGKTVPDVTWELTEATAGVYAEFADPYSPVLHLIQTGAAVKDIVLTVHVTLTNTSGETRVVEKTIGLWNRIPEVGDYAWTDGQFDNTNDDSKKMSGMVVRKTAVEVDGITVYDLDVLSAADTVFPTSQVSGGYEGSWGPYPAVAQGFSDAKNDDGSYQDPVLEAIRQALQNWTPPTGTGIATHDAYRTDVFDTPLPNITGSIYLRKNQDAVTQAGDGFAMQDEGAVASDGYNLNNAPTYVTNFNTVGENTVMKSFADVVLIATLSALSITQEDYPEGCTSEGIPTTTQALYQLAELIVQRASDQGADNPSRYRELLFPALRRCWVWSPSEINGALIDESKLHDSYKRGSWMMPSSGLLSRIFNFVGNSRPDYNTGSVDASLANEDVALEALLPLFSNAIARGRTVPISAGSNHWSSTETYRYVARFVYFGSGLAYYNGKYNGYVGRAVTVFRFVP